MEVDNSKMTIFVHIDALKHDQAQLARKLVQERTLNCQLRKELAAIDQQYLETRLKRSQATLETAEMQFTLVKSLQEVSELQKSIQEEEALTSRANKSAVQLRELNQEWKSKIVTHLTRVALYHQRLTDTSARAPMARDAAQKQEELRRLKTDNQKLRLQIAQFDKQLLETVAAQEAEKQQLELDVQQAKARITELKARKATQKNAEDKQIHHLQRAIEIQTANNDAVEAENQAMERDLFNCSSSGPATTAVPLSPPGGEHAPAATVEWPELNL